MSNSMCNCVNESKPECEIAYQSKIGFEYVIECQIYCINQCETESEITYLTWYKAESVIEYQSESHIPNVKVKV